MSDKSLISLLALGLQRKSAGAAESGFFSRWGWNAKSWSGVAVSEQTALQNDTVWACTKLISDAVSTLPIGVYRREPDGGRTLATDHRLYDLLHNEPNTRMTAVNYWQAMVASMLLWGNGYSEIKRIGDRITSLEFLDPARVSLRPDTARGGVPGFQYWDGYEQRSIERESVLHVKGFTLDGESGVSAIRFGAHSIGSAIAAEKAAHETFRDASRATGMLTVDAVLRSDQREQIRGHIKRVSGEGGVYVMEKGSTYQTLKFNPADAELLASRSFSVETICRWFRVPPVMIGHGDKQSSWPTSTEAQGALFLRYVLRSLITGIEQEIRRSLLTAAQRQTYFAEFAIEGLLRGDSAARAAFYSTALQNGWMSRNEVRRFENLPPAEGGDVFTVQSNMLPIEQLGRVPAAPTAQPNGAGKALERWLELQEKERAS